jgi:hypothetical protein
MKFYVYRLFYQTRLHLEHLLSVSFGLRHVKQMAPLTAKRGKGNSTNDLSGMIIKTSVVGFNGQ